MKVWRISSFNNFIILDSIEDTVRELKIVMGEVEWSQDTEEEIKISFEEMDKKDYENLPEFDGWW